VDGGGYSPHASLNDGSGIVERRELVHVQALVPQTSIKRFKKGVFHGFARSNEVQLNIAPIGPIFECSRLKFGAMIDGDGARTLAFTQNAIEHLTHPLA
jgi:hypothetical protein